MPLNLSFSRVAYCTLILISLGKPLAHGEDNPMVLPGNMKVLRCAMPTSEYRFVASSAPGQLFFADEPVEIKLVIAKGADKGEVNWAIEIQEIGTRDPDAKIEGTFTDTAGLAPKLGLIGDPVTHPIKLMLADADTPVTISNLPIPKRFGTYALVLVRGGERQFLATVCRVPKPQAKANLENTPIFGEFAMFDRQELYDARAATCDRMGVRGLRLETSWSEREDGTYEWERTDKIFAAMEKHRIQVMVTLGGHHGWMWPFGPNKQTPAAVANTNWDGNPYWGQADWVCDPKLYPRYGKWIEAFCRRYWKDGSGPLWGLENYNEPWEGGGISGWARDALQYREIQKTIAEAARKVDPKIKLAAASSIMNTEDKLYSDGSPEFDKYVDVFTDHYVVPPMCYGPMVAKAHGKQSVETETWFVNSEYLTPQIVQFLAAGQLRLSPWHPRVLFDRLPGTEDNYFIPTPAVAATAAFNYFVSGKEFNRLVFHDHLPWAFQFGKDNDKDGLLVVFGQLMTIAGNSPKERLWAQVDGTPGGTITIDNADGLLKFYDLAGNAQYVGQKQVVLPMSIYPAYITSDQGPGAAAQRLRAAKIDGKRPVEILPHELSSRVDAPGAKLEVTVHNCLNRTIKGKLAVKAPADIKLAAAELQVELKAGESKRLQFAFASATPNAAQAYPFEFAFTSDAGDVKLSEVKNLAIAVKGTKQIDGNLDDWKDVPGVTVVAEGQQGDLTELLRRPWLDLKNQKPDGSFGEFKLAWDENYLYVAARINDKSPQPASPRMAGRDVNQYFHTSASDTISPFKEFLKDFPGRSFANVAYVYRYSPEKPQTKDLPVIPFRRDRLHIALDVSDDWHDLAPTTDRVPAGFHAIPDTDYEYALYGCDGGSELWRMLAPGVPRIHDFPRTPRGARTTDAVPNAKHVVKFEGNTYTYELAIPKAELANLKLQAGTTFGLMLRGGNNDGPHVDYAADKAETKINGLTLHPYWERSSNCGVRWKLVE